MRATERAKGLLEGRTLLQQEWRDVGVSFVVDVFDCGRFERDVEANRRGLGRAPLCGGGEHGSRRMSEARFEALSCQECPSSGVGLARIRLKFKVMGETRVVERVIAVDPDEAGCIDGMVAEVRNSDELSGRAN